MLLTGIEKLLLVIFPGFQWRSLALRRMCINFYRTLNTLKVHTSNSRPEAQTMESNVTETYSCQLWGCFASFSPFLSLVCSKQKQFCCSILRKWQIPGCECSLCSPNLWEIYYTSVTRDLDLLTCNPHFKRTNNSSASAEQVGAKQSPLP